LIYVLLWWLMVELLGWVALPIAFWAFRWLPDRGYAFSKAIGLLLASYLLWLGASVGLLRNEASGIFFSILLVFVFSIWLYVKKIPSFSLPNFLRQNKRLILCVEILFTLAFISWVVLRAFAPDKVMSAGGEKFMEIAFLNGTLNSPTFPPLDPWLSGFSISYYYFGYVMMALLTRITGALPGVGFDLYDALLFALTVVGAFGVVYNLVAAGLKEGESVLPGGSELSNGDQQPFIQRQPLVYGILGALFVVVMGNLEGMLEVLRSKGILPEAFWRWIDIPDLLNSPVTGSWNPGSVNNWWWWRASRVIQDRDLLGQPMGVSPITEFPFFSFLLGDNHPHVLALPFVLLMIALAFNLMRSRFNAQPNDTQATWWNPVQFAMQGDWLLFILYALCLGSLGFLNTWDMPIYLGLVVLAFGVGEYSQRMSTSERKGLDWELLGQMAVLGIGLLAAAVLGYILFYISFSSQAGGVLPYVFPPTRLPQYLVMFGTFIFIITWFLLVSLRRLARLSGRHAIWQAALAAWSWVLVICVAVFLLVMLLILALTGWGSRLLGEIPQLQSVLGGTDVAQALQRTLIYRLTNPWLFLALTLLIGLSITNIMRSIQLETEQNGTSVESEGPQAAEHSPSTSQLFAFLLIFLGLALTLSVEFFYLRDSFSVRMNTIFKFYFQAWIMLGCASAFGIWWILNEAKPVLSVAVRTIFLASCTLLIAAGLVYPLIAGYSRVSGFSASPNLDGTSSLAKNNPDDWAAIEWLRTKTKGTPVILEAPGKSYSYEGRISAFSGLPSVLGWSLHEAQWRGNYDEQGMREPDIETIYTTRDPLEALELLDKWNVKYVVVGPSEINYIQRLCNDSNRGCNLPRSLAKFDTILAPVFQQGNVTIYQVPGERN
jgi:YYY domain-containing protein